MGCLAIHAATLRGVEAAHVTVEVALSGGLPNITVVGNPLFLGARVEEPHPLRDLPVWLRGAPHGRHGQPRTQ